LPFSFFTTSPFCILAEERLYNHRATTKLPTAQPQTSTAIDEVTSSAGTRTKSATPIQNRAKMMAEPRAKRIVDREKITKMRRGRNERRSCDTMKDCLLLDELRVKRAESDLRKE